MHLDRYTEACIKKLVFDFKSSNKMEFVNGGSECVFLEMPPGIKQLQKNRSEERRVGKECRL